jgi:Replication-relaxation
MDSLGFVDITSTIHTPTRYVVMSRQYRIRVYGTQRKNIDPAGGQLDRLLADPDTTAATTARVRRRIMARLHQLGLVLTLQRKVGGARAGSAGHVYTLSLAGYRFLAILSDQPCPAHVKRPTTPSGLFLGHMLAISDIYVQLIITSRDRNIQLATFAIEPACWQPTPSGDILKPDAYCVLSTATHQDCWWLEIDQNTESLPRIRTKARAYLDYLSHGGLGPDHVPPRVLYTTPDTPRTDAINHLITTLSTQDTSLINATTRTEATEYLIKELLAT